MVGRALTLLAQSFGGYDRLVNGLQRRLIHRIRFDGLVLRADNDGEGGILALLSLVEHRDATGQRAKLSIVIVLGVIGAALLYGDGVITPAISVLSAIEGLKSVPRPRITSCRRRL